VIERLLGAVPVAAFMEGHFLRLPYAVPGGCRHLTHLGTWQAVGAVLPRAGVDVLAGREGRRWEGATPATGHPSLHVTGVADARRLALGPPGRPDGAVTACPKS
jgi:hypothetical protein